MPALVRVAAQVDLSSATERGDGRNPPAPGPPAPPRTETCFALPLVSGSRCLAQTLVAEGERVRYQTLGAGLGTDWPGHQRPFNRACLPPALGRR